MSLHIVLHSTDLIGDSGGVICISNKIIAIAIGEIVTPSKSVIFSIGDVSSSVVDQIARTIHLIGGFLCCD